MTLPYEQAQSWLARTREDLSRGWPTTITGPDGQPLRCGHSGAGYAVIEDGSEIEVAPGVSVSLDDLMIGYQ